jgi:hypothetical protein
MPSCRTGPRSMLPSSSYLLPCTRQRFLQESSSAFLKWISVDIFYRYLLTSSLRSVTLSKRRCCRYSKRREEKRREEKRRERKKERKKHHGRHPLGREALGRVTGRREGRILLVEAKGFHFHLESERSSAPCVGPYRFVAPSSPSGEEGLPRSVGL